MPNPATEEEINSIIQQPNPIPDQEAILKEEEQEVAQEEKTLDTMTDEEMEAQASERGWNPNFNGPNKKSAKEFLEVAEKSMPILLSDKKRLQQENEILRKSHQKMMETSAETIKRQKAEMEKRIAELEVQKKEAKDNLDTEALEKVMTEQAQVKQDKQELERSAPPVDPTVVMWWNENKDFTEKVQNDKSLEDYSNFLALQNHEKLLTMPPADRFEYVKKRVMEDLPHKFANPNQQQAPRTLTMNRTQTPNKSAPDKLTTAALPKEEKAAYDIMVKAQRFKTDAERKAFDERYLENYKVMSGEK